MTNWLRSVCLLTLGGLIFGVSEGRAGTCAADVYTVYKAANFTCTIGVLTFSAFSDITGNLTSADINVVPLPDGLRFDFSLSTSSQNATEKSFNFNYDVTAPVSLYNAYLTFTGQGTDPGVTARVTENVGPTLLVEQTGGSGFANDGTNIPSAYTPLDVANVTVTDTALVKTIATGNVRTASISSLTNTFLPEPGTWSLMALGAFALIARRFRIS